MEALFCRNSYLKKITLITENNGSYEGKNGWGEGGEKKRTRGNKRRVRKEEGKRGGNGGEISVLPDSICAPLLQIVHHIKFCMKEK